MDSLFLLLLFAGIYLVRFGSSYRSIAIAGAFFALSALTKQTAVVIVPARDFVPGARGSPVRAWCWRARSPPSLEARR